MNTDLETFCKACNGAVEAFVVSRQDLFWMILSTDERTRATCRAIGHWLRIAAHSEKGKRPLCLNCDVQFSAEHHPHSILVTLPFADPTQALVTGICDDCAARLSPEMIVQALRKVWPDAHITQGGRA